jgi:hypothetical protein
MIRRLRRPSGIRWLTAWLPCLRFHGTTIGVYARRVATSEQALGAAIKSGSAPKMRGALEAATNAASASIAANRSAGACPGREGGWGRVLFRDPTCVLLFKLFGLPLTSCS